MVKFDINKCNINAAPEKLKLLQAHAEGSASPVEQMVSKLLGRRTRTTQHSSASKQSAGYIYMNEPAY